MYFPAWYKFFSSNNQLLLALKEIEQHVAEMLQNGLDPIYSYHNVAHTLDVARQAMIIASEENPMNDQAFIELQLAALYHDTGFLHHWFKHEEQSCLVVRADLPVFGVTPEQLDNICQLIMVTKVPHNPTGILQEIICDADLDYLGREDFFTISERLFREFMACGIVKSKTEWQEQQISFLESHRYFTSSSNRRRNPLKQNHIQYLLQAMEKK